MVKVKLKVPSAHNQSDSLKACGGTSHGVHTAVIEYEAGRVPAVV